MVCRCIAPLLLALLTVAPPCALTADDCGSSPGSGVRLSASSSRNVTGHWLTTAAITRTTSKDADGSWPDERRLQYDVDITRRSCGDEETLTTTFRVAVPPTGVGADYTFFPRVGYYKLHTDKRNWEDARIMCIKEGAHLAIMNSEEEDESAVRELMRPHLQDDGTAFINTCYSFNEGECEMISDEMGVRGRIDTTDPKECATMNADGEIGFVLCSLELPFLCQKSV